MKKLFALTLITLLCASLMLVPVSAARDEIFEANYGTPVIDGKLDDAYQRSDLIVFDVKSNYASVPDGFTNFAGGWVRVLWDDSNIYIYGNITDPTPAKNAAKFDSSTDGVDIYIRTGSYFKDVKPASETDPDRGQFRIIPAIKQDGDLAVRPASWGGLAVENQTNSTYKYIVEYTATGYIFECVIKFDADFIAKNKENVIMGLGIQINDDINDDNAREGIMVTSNAQMTMSSNTGNLGELRLVKKAPETTAAPSTTAAPGTTSPSTPSTTKAASATSAPGTTPATSDSMISIAVTAVMLACGAAAVLIAKRRHLRRNA